MRILGVSAFVTATILVSLATLPATAQLPPIPHGPDGVTSKIRPNGLNDMHFRRDAEGLYSVQIVLYQKSGAVWSQAGLPATLRVFVCIPDVEVTHNATADPLHVELQAHVGSDCWQDRISIPFTSSADEGVRLTFDPADLDNPTTNNPRLIDVFVTFASPGLEGHTSHHGLLKNEFIGIGEFNPVLHDACFDVADALDYYGTAYAVAA
jgi:hypothetical protein